MVASGLGLDDRHIVFSANSLLNTLGVVARVHDFIEHGCDSACRHARERYRIVRIMQTRRGSECRKRKTSVCDVQMQFVRAVASGISRGAHIACSRKLSKRSCEVLFELFAYARGFLDRRLRTLRRTTSFLLTTRSRFTRTVGFSRAWKLLESRQTWCTNSGPTWVRTKISLAMSKTV